MCLKFEKSTPINRTTRGTDRPTQEPGDNGLFVAPGSR